MRLIDADALMDDATVTYIGGNGYIALWRIDEFPEINPDSLRPKGRWEVNKDYGDYECSVCKSGDITALHFSQLRMNFCPNCGAKMEV